MDRPPVPNPIQQVYRDIITFDGLINEFGTITCVIFPTKVYVRFSAFIQCSWLGFCLLDGFSARVLYFGSWLTAGFLFFYFFFSFLFLAEQQLPLLILDHFFSSWLSYSISSIRFVCLFYSYISLGATTCTEYF